MNNYRPVFYKALSQKAEVDGRRVSGYLAAYGNKDLDGEILIRGAVAKSLQEHGPGSKSNRKVAFLYQHDIRQPLGQFVKLEEKDGGLYYEADIDKIPIGDQVIEQLKSGTLNQHSIGYRYIWDKMEWDEQQQAMVLKEIELFEGSVVTIGANENTPFLGMKAAEKESQYNLIQRELERILKELNFEKQYELRQLIAKYAALIEQEPPAVALIKSVEPRAEMIDWQKVSKLIINK